MNCENWGKTATKPRRCPNCKTAIYCSQEWRKQHWVTSHAEQCGPRKQQKPYALSDFTEIKDKNMANLGKGSYGLVKLVQHRGSKDLYALKTIDKNKISEEASIEVLKREISIHMNMKHENIIRLYDFVEEEEKVHLILEFAQGGSMFHEIRRRRRLTEEVARDFFTQTCKGIKYLHDQSIIHRDIKPENILIAGRDVIKICDFGWCVEGGDIRLTFCGTLDYMAPEMIMGGGHSYKLDVWALGVLIYEMVHGYAPFRANKESDKCQQILNLEISFANHVSAPLKDMIEQILQVEPEDRPTVDAILQHQWITQKSVNLVGQKVYKYVESYGNDEGVVTDMNGMSCTITWFGSGTSSKMTIEETQKLIEEGDTRHRSHNHSRNDSFNNQTFDQTFDSGPSTIDKSKENQLLSQIEEWCNIPSKHPYRSDRDISYIDRANEKLKESLAELSARGQASPEQIKTLLDQSQSFEVEQARRKPKFVDSMQDLMIQDYNDIPKKQPKKQKQKSKVPKVKKIKYQKQKSAKNSQRGDDIDLLSCERRQQDEYAGYAGETAGNPALLLEDRSGASTINDSDIKDWNESKGDLEKRKRELQALIDEVQGSGDMSIISRERRMQHQKSESGGVLAWFGRLLGCSDKRRK